MDAVIGKRTILQQLINPPFSRPYAELERLCDEQLLFLYDVKRGDGGVMVAEPVPSSSPPPSLKGMHARRCFLLGITSPEKVAKLWAAEAARIAAAREVGKSRSPGRTHKRRKGG